MKFNKMGLVSIVSLTFLAYMLIARIMLLIMVPAGEKGGLAALVKVFATGAIFDLSTLSYALIPVAIYLCLAPGTIVHSRFHSRFILSLYAIFNAAMIFDLCAEYLFFDEFGTRFNFIAVDYLIYTNEVIGNIRESYPMPLLLSAITAFALIVTLLMAKQVCAAAEKTFRASYHRMGLYLLFPPILAIFLVNGKLSQISTNSYVNEIAGNGIYNLVAAFRNNELSFERFYYTEAEEKVLTRLKQNVLSPGSRYVDPLSRPFTRRINSNGTEKKLNLIVIVEESLSSEFLGAFGNKEHLTPHLDKLATESLVFTNLYATGTRTVRGLEAITLSLPPLPGTSIVKRPDNGNFNSFGSILQKKGYETKYIYAGYGYFDNMNAFYAANGFSIVDRTSFSSDEITFANIWGVCDEDLFKKTILESRKSFAAKKPFFSMVMTTSNHRPYTYPEGKIDIPSKTGRAGGVKYADYSVGQFIAMAKKEPWFKDTVIVILADHCASSAGKTDIPVRRYEIPMFVYAPSNVKPGKYTTVASQIDVAPTLLGMLNMSYDSDFFGKDLLNDASYQPRAFISTYQKLGYLTDKELTVLGPLKYMHQYEVDRNNGKLKPILQNNNHLLDALSYYQGGSIIHQKKWNRILKTAAKP